MCVPLRVCYRARATQEADCGNFDCTYPTRAGQRGQFSFQTLGHPDANANGSCRRAEKRSEGPASWIFPRAEEERAVGGGWLSAGGGVLTGSGGEESPLRGFLQETRHRSLVKDLLHCSLQRIPIVLRHLLSAESE